MKNETGYKGKVMFAKDIRYDFIITFLNCDEVLDGYVYLGECDVDVTFLDSRPGEIDALEKQITEERANAQRRIETINERIQELRALTHSVGE